MQVLQAVITGAIQGLSEFLPISSSAHITFSNEIYNIITGTIQTSSSYQEEIFFDILVHLATLFAVVLYFFNDLKTIFLNGFVALKEKNFQNNELKLIGYIALATIITGVIGLLIKKPTEALIKTPQCICIILMITGFILLLSEKMYKGDKKITLKSAIFIAIAQGLAVFPGFSRSGFTISTALFQGIERFEAARFSFLMSIPVIFLASLIYPLMELDLSVMSSFNYPAIFMGTLTSFVVGYICIKYFMALLKKATLKFFGYYCLFVSLLMFLLFQVCHHI